MTAVGVMTRKELEALWSKHYTDESVRESVEELLTAEDNHRAFIREVDVDLQKVEDKLRPTEISSLGSQLPGELSLVEATSQKSITIESLLKQSRFTLFIFRKHYK